MPISRDSIYSLLQQYGKTKDLVGGRHVHALMVSHQLDTVAVLADHLIRIFSSCQSLLEASLSFCTVLEPSVFTWHSIISAYTSAGESNNAIQLYQRMLGEGTTADKFVYTSVLKACADTRNVELGTELHDLIIRSQLESDVVVGSALIDMYSKCDGPIEAEKLFSNLFSRNAISWNTIIAKRNQYDNGNLAIELYDEMQRQGVKPERSTFSSIIKACTNTGAIDRGKYIHEQVVKSGLELDKIVGSTLIDMYVKCGKLDVAREVFDKLHERDIVSWGAMISGYVQHDDNFSALELFECLLQEEIHPNKVVFSSVLRACACIQGIKHARLVHHHIVKTAFECDKVVGSSLVDIYAKWGSLKEAFNIFRALPNKDVVAWNAIITGYMQYGLGRTSLFLFIKMMNSQVQPDRITFLGTLKACGMVGAIERGKLMHHQIIQSGLDFNISIGSCLVDMYAKCGNLMEAAVLFEKLPERNVVSWGAMIAGYAQHGNHRLVVECLHEMTRQGILPNSTIYINIFSACSHAGEVKLCQEYFNLMVNVHGIRPHAEHFNCMVDVLGRTGLLEEAKLLLEMMPLQADVTCWASLLTSCETYGDVDLGIQCFDQLVKIDPEYASSYVLMDKLYADMKFWDHIRKSQDQRRIMSEDWKMHGMGVKNSMLGSTSEEACKNRRLNKKLNLLIETLVDTRFVQQIGSLEFYEDDDEEQVDMFDMALAESMSSKVPE